MPLLLRHISRLTPIELLVESAEGRGRHRPHQRERQFCDRRQLRRVGRRHVGYLAASVLLLLLLLAFEELLLGLTGFGVLHRDVDRFGWWLDALCQFFCLFVGLGNFVEVQGCRGKLPLGRVIMQGRPLLVVLLIFVWQF